MLLDWDSPMFKSDNEAYEWCQRVYRESGGVTPALREAYEFYLRNFRGDDPPEESK